MPESRRRIIVGVDFSPSSEIALRFAAELAAEMQADLVLAHMCQLTMSAVPEKMLTEPDDSATLAEAERGVQEQAHRIAERVPATALVRVADPVLGLLQLVDELKPVMLIVGSHGRGAVMRLLLGSVAEQLSRRSPVPVVVVPAPERAAALREATERA